MSSDEPTGGDSGRDERGGPVVDPEAVTTGAAPDDGGAEETPTEYAIEGLPSSRAPEGAEREPYRKRFGRVQTYFRSRPDRFADYQRTLNQARTGESYDEYLTRAIGYALLAGLVGGLLGLVLTVGLVRGGVFAGLTSPVAVGGPVAAFVGTHRVLFGGAAITLLFALLAFGVTWGAFYYHPTTVVSSRRQQLNITLPHAIVYMYALSYGGMSLAEVLRSVADAEETYGEVAREVDTVVREIDLFGNDIYTALQNTRNRTPSDAVEGFLDDLVSVLDSGGDVTLFLENEAEDYLEQAREEQEDFLETLSLLAEIFVVGFVATPLFLVVIMVVISLVGGSTLSSLTALVYLVMPVGMVAFLVLVDVLSSPFVQTGTVSGPDRGTEASIAPPTGDDRYEAYRRVLRFDRVRSFARDPARVFRRTPLVSLVVTVPVAAVAAGLVVLSGVEPSVGAFVDDPVVTTVGLVVVPLFLVATPLMVFHERRRRRRNTLARRFPQTLNILSSANKMGIRLTEGLELVSRSSSGLLAEELQRVRNDILWNGSTSDALLAFGARVRIPQLARTTRLVAEGVESSGDLSRVLSIAAEDARNRYRLDRARRRELSSYIAIVVIGYLVYLLVVVMLEVNYLDTIAATPSGGPSGPGAPEPPIGLANVPVDVYRAVFFHSALVQGMGSGLLAGKLAEDDLLSGLKYGLALVALAVLVFVVI